MRACAPSAAQKQDAANQTNKQTSSVKQPSVQTFLSFVCIEIVVLFSNYFIV